MFENLRRDITKYEDHGRWYTNPGFWIVAIYRFGMWADSLPSKFLRIPMWILYRILKLTLRHHNVHLWAGRSGTRIGAGLKLIHPTNVMIGNNVEIGKDCLIFHDVTLGTGQIPGTPKIGNNVDIYPGARVLGGVTIGDHSMVGANCVVTRDVPPDSIILTPPGRVIPRSLSPVARGADQETATSTNQVLP
ncbi:MAG: serine acetyltransferase [Gallionella sp.]|nr:serine acetyltransferase [Gallionella sp.]